MSYVEWLSSTFDVFSRRPPPDDQRYMPDDISKQLRTRILLLYRDVISGEWDEALGQWRPGGDYTVEFWEEMYNRLQYLYGRWELYNGAQGTCDEMMDTFLWHCKTNEFFDFIELSFKLKSTFKAMPRISEIGDAINEFFRIEDAPYKLTRMYGYPGTNRIAAYPQIIRVEDEVTHNEAVAPALSVLSAPHFEAANSEFRDAMKEYRDGHYGDCLTKCGSAFESVLKVLCKRNKWPFGESDTAGPLMKVVIEKSTLDSFFEQPLMLIATIRNRLSSSHGAGNKPRDVERHIGQYALTSTAAAIVLLVHEADR